MPSSLLEPTGFLPILRTCRLSSPSDPDPLLCNLHCILIWQRRLQLSVYQRFPGLPSSWSVHPPFICILAALCWRSYKTTDWCRRERSLPSFSCAFTLISSLVPPRPTSRSSAPFQRPLCLQPFHRAFLPMELEKGGDCFLSSPADRRCAYPHPFVLRKAAPCFFPRLPRSPGL